MSTPILLALLALVTHGLAMFFWKVAGSSRSYGPSYMIVESVAYAAVGVAIHLFQRQRFDLGPRMMGLAVIGGIIAGIGFLGLFLAFRLGGEGSVVFPIAGLGVIVAVVLAVIVFKEPITATKLLGFGFGVTSIVLLSR